MLPSFANKTVTVLRAPLVDSRGTKERDWSNCTSHVVNGCSFQPSAASLGLDIREAVSSDAVLYAPWDADIRAADRIQYRGRTYVAMGDPLPWESPTGALDHSVVNLEAWHG